MATPTNQTFALGPVQMRVLLPGSAGASHSMQEMHVPPGFRGSPEAIHHTRESCTWLVLEGTLAMTINGTEELIEAGKVTHVEPFDDFAWSNASDTAALRMVCIYSPGGFEQMLVKTASALADRGIRQATPDVLREVLPPLWREYGIEVAGAKKGV